MNDPAHPVWSTIRFVAISVVATLALYFNASNFDETEIRSLLWVLGTLAGLEGAGQTLRSLKKGKP